MLSCSFIKETVSIIKRTETNVPIFYAKFFSGLLFRVEQNNKMCQHIEK